MSRKISKIVYITWRNSSTHVQWKQSLMSVTGTHKILKGSG